jgi:hypothetical protein
MTTDCNRHLKTCGLELLVKDLRKNTADDAQQHNDEWWREHMEAALQDGDSPDYDGDLVIALR